MGTKVFDGTYSTKVTTVVPNCSGHNSLNCCLLGLERPATHIVSVRRLVHRNKGLRLTPAEEENGVLESEAPMTP